MKTRLQRTTARRFGDRCLMKAGHRASITASEPLGDDGREEDFALAEDYSAEEVELAEARQRRNRARDWRLRPARLRQARASRRDRAGYAQAPPSTAIQRAVRTQGLAIKEDIFGSAMSKQAKRIVGVGRAVELTQVVRQAEERRPMTPHRWPHRIVEVGVATLVAATLGGGPARASVGPSSPAEQSADVAAIEEEVSGFGFGGLTRPFNQVGTPLLDQFYFRFRDNDHHLGHMSAYPESDGTIFIAFQDDSDDYEYFYRVAHERVSAAGVVLGSFDDICLRSCFRDIARPAGDYVFVLTGFRFYYTGNRDRHFDGVGVLESRGRVTAYLHDEAQDNSDTFVTHVSYAWVPRARISTVSAIDGEVDGEGGVRHSGLPGTKVISGFRVLGLTPDRHIRELGIMTNSDNIEIYNGDDSPGDDRWYYRVKYAALI